jgi:hypothetical protein
MDGRTSVLKVLEISLSAKLLRNCEMFKVVHNIRVHTSRTRDSRQRGCRGVDVTPRDMFPELDEVCALVVAERDGACHHEFVTLPCIGHMVCGLEGSGGVILGLNRREIV